MFCFVLLEFSLPLWFVNAFLCNLTWMNYTGHLNHEQNKPSLLHYTNRLTVFFCVCVSAGCQLLAPWPVGGPCCSAQTLTTVPTNQSTGRCLEKTIPLFWLSWLNYKSLLMIVYDAIQLWTEIHSVSLAGCITQTTHRLNIQHTLDTPPDAPKQQLRQMYRARDITSVRFRSHLATRNASARYV